MCCIRAALVGGRASIALPLLVNNSQRALSIIIDDGASAIVEYIGVGMGEGRGSQGSSHPHPPNFETEYTVYYCEQHTNWFIASFMLYVHSSKAEEFDLKTIARNSISDNTRYFGKL